MDEVLQAIETLVVNNCLTLSEALEKTYLAGHRKAAKELETKSTLTVIRGMDYGSTPGGSISS
jgi:hypothetical protein